MTTKTLIISGEAEVLAKASPVLEAMGIKITDPEPKLSAYVIFAVRGSWFITMIQGAQRAMKHADISADDKALLQEFIKNNRKPDVSYKREYATRITKLLFKYAYQHMGPGKQMYIESEFLTECPSPQLSLLSK